MSRGFDLYTPKRSFPRLSLRLSLVLSIRVPFIYTTIRSTYHRIARDLRISDTSIAALVTCSDVLQARIVHRSDCRKYRERFHQLRSNANEPK